MATPIITAARLRELLRYDPATGVFTWRPRAEADFPGKRTWAWKVWNRRYAGKLAGVKRPDGYILISIQDTKYHAHRIAWTYMTGTLPMEIDHRDGIKDNNRFANLRDCTRLFNSQNRRAPCKNGTTGILGVTRNAYGFIAQIGIDARCIYLGTYQTPEEAQAAYIAVKRAVHAGCTI